MISSDSSPPKAFQLPEGRMADGLRWQGRRRGGVTRAAAALQRRRPGRLAGALQPLPSRLPASSRVEAHRGRPGEAILQGGAAPCQQEARQTHGPAELLHHGHDRTLSNPTSAPGHSFGGSGAPEAVHAVRAGSQRQAARVPLLLPPFHTQVPAPLYYMQHGPTNRSMRSLAHQQAGQ